MAKSTITGSRVNRKPRHHDHRAPGWASLLAELLGTFFLTFVSAAPIVIGALTGKLGVIEKTAPAGMLVAAMIYSVGALSGAHLNPAVTLAFVLRGVFPWQSAPPYWLAQLLGATIAGGVIFLMFGGAAHDGANLPHLGTWQSFALEILFTFLLVLVILCTGSEHKIVGANAALAVGMVIALCGFVGGPISGASMNPARSFGAALFGGAQALRALWIYIVAPCLGSLGAAGVMRLLYGRADDAERRVAGGRSELSH